MIGDIVVWLLVVAFVGAGIVNALGAAGTRTNMVRWGYPGWWCHVTGGLELVSAALIGLPASRELGLILGASITLAAALTVLRHRDYAHLGPLGVFIALLALVQTLA